MKRKEIRRQRETHTQLLYRNAHNSPHRPARTSSVDNDARTEGSCVFHRNDSYHGDRDSELLNISALVVKE